VLIRPVDTSGDILPVSSVSSLLSGPTAMGQLARNRLRLLKGDWWETPEEGFQALELIRNDRITENNVDQLSAYISSFLLETPGVIAVEEVDAEMTGRTFSYACRLIGEDGSENLSWSLAF